MKNIFSKIKSAVGSTLRGVKSVIGGFLGEISKLVAKFYNGLPKAFRIALMVCLGYIFAKWTQLLIIDLEALNVTNQYIRAVIESLTNQDGSGVGLLTIVYNLIQEYVRMKGTELLVIQGNSKTIDQLETKVQDTQDILNKAP